MKKIVFLIGIFLMFLFAFNAKGNAMVKVEKEKSGSYFSTVNSHPSSFLQPQTVVSFISNHPVNDFVPGKWFAIFVIGTPVFKASKSFIVFSFQDIDRCENVSLLLFPYHIFW